MLLLQLANRMNQEQLASMKDKNKYFIMQNVFHCCICKFETIISTAWQCVLLFFHPLAGSLLFCFLFLGCSAFKNNCWYLMTETKITIPFAHQSTEPWTFLLPYVFDPWNVKSNTKKNSIIKGNQCFRMGRQANKLPPFFLKDVFKLVLIIHKILNFINAQRSTI